MWYRYDVAPLPTRQMVGDEDTGRRKRGPRRRHLSMRVKGVTTLGVLTLALAVGWAVQSRRPTLAPDDPGRCPSTALSSPTRGDPHVPVHGARLEAIVDDGPSTTQLARSKPIPICEPFRVVTRACASRFKECMRNPERFGVKTLYGPSCGEGNGATLGQHATPIQ